MVGRRLSDSRADEPTLAGGRARMWFDDRLNFSETSLLGGERKKLFVSISLVYYFIVLNA